MNTKSNLLKSIFISLILVMGVGSMNAANTMRIYCKNTQSWWKSENAAVGAYYWGTGGNANSWPGTRMTKVSGQTDLWYIDVDIDKYQNIIFTRVPGSETVSDWGAKTGDLTISNTKNQYTITQSSGAWNGATSAGSWGTYKPTSTAALTASPASVYVGEDVTLTPSLSSNTDANTYSSTSYSVSPATASVTGNTFTATAADTYTVTATVTYYPLGCPTLTSTATATTTVTVTIPTHTVSYGVCSSTRWGSIQLNSETAITTTGTKTLNYGTSISFTAKPNAGYQVEGWYSNSSCTSKITAAGTSTTYDAGTLTADKTVYVKFEAIPVNSHNITYTEQGEGWTYDNSNPTSAEEGATVTFVVNPTAGYRVDVSSDGPALTGPNANNQYTFTMPNKDIKITVEAKPEQYTVTLNKQSGTGGASSVTATYLVAMPSITPPTRTGYTFNGYFDATSDGTKYYNANGSSAKSWDKTAATTLYAQWTANKYTVTFNANDGTGTMSNQSFEYDETKPLTANAFTRKGYEFTGWNTKDDGTGTAYTDKQSVSNLSSTNGATVTLYAQWNQLSPTTVYINPKTNWEETLKIICDEEEEDMTPVGCDGYYTAEVPGGTTELKFGGNGEQTLSLTVPTDDKVLYDMTSTNITHLYLKPNSNWTRANARFAAYFFGDGEEWVNMTAVTGQSGLYEVTIPTGKSYTSVIFCRMNPSSNTNGWTQDTQLWNQTNDLEITDGKNQYTVADGAWSKGSGTWSTIYDNSKWTTYAAPQYAITTESGKGGTIEISPSSSVALNEQITVTMTADPGYSFQSGTIKIGNQEEQTISTTESTHTICGPTAITATWKPDSHKVTFDANGHGTAPDEQSVNHNEKVEEPEAPTANGYTFGGWYTDANCTTAWNFDTDVVTGNITLYAQWTATEYTITYKDQGGSNFSGEHADGHPTTHTYGTATTLKDATKTGYSFGGWFDNKECTGTAIESLGATAYTANITLYAKWTGREYTITFEQQSGTGGTNSVTATYGSAMPSITVPTRTGYHFDGYYTETNGGGTQYYKADGSSARTWNKTSATTLYAYFQKAEITGIAFDKGEVPEGGYVTFEPTIEPKPSGNTVICWELKKGETTIDNSYIIPVEKTNNVKISIAELVADKGKGIYTIKATLRTGTGCESGTELSSYETNFANTDFILSTPIYLKPSATWQQHDARFAVYYWGNGENNNGWVDMNTIGCSDEYYAAEIPIGYSDFKFVRLDPDKTENNWDNRWCETGNLTIPADGKNLFDMTQIYLNAQQGWTNDGARFAAYFYVKGEDSKTKWMSMSHVKDNIYKCDIPDDYNFDWVIFGRMNGSTSTNNWDNKWNQTNDLELTTDNVTHGNYYTIIDMGSNGEKSSGSWSWNDIAWSKLDLPTITITNNNPTCGSISVKTIDGTEIASGTKVDWDTEVVVSIQPNAGYAVKSSSIDIGGTTETIQPGKTYTICGNTTINISFEEKSEYYIIGIDGNWDSFQEKYKFIDGKVLLSLKKEGGNPSFKIAKVKGGKLETRYGKKTTFTFKGNINTSILSDANSTNDHCVLETVHDGDYLFVWDENTKTLTIEYPDVIFLHGTFNDRKDKASHALHDRDAIVYLTAGSDYEFKVAEKGIYYTATDYTTKMTKTGDSKTMDDDNNYNTDPYHNCTVNASVTGLYTFHFDKETRVLTVTYPEDNTLAVGDYRLQYTNGTNSYYTDHVKKRTSGDGVDTVSLFILNAGTEPRVILQRCTNASGNGTWKTVTTHNLSDMTLDNEMTDEHGGVWNFIIAQTDNGANATVSNATNPERYTGKYYIRTDAADGGWNEYPIPENEIFFSSYARDNEGFDYYYCKYIGYGTNVKYNIANDYNSRLNSTDYDTDALVSSGSMPADGNVRFMWNSRTNELVGRAYLDGSSTENFLRITNATNLYDADGKNSINEIKFTDLQNWIYQVDVQANTNTQIKLKAIYNGNEQFFKGDNDNTVSLLTSNNTSKNYKIRLIYNFKTNHLVCAWLGGDETITTDEKLTADMMIIRRDQEQAEQLSFNPNTKQLDLEGTAYAVMTFTKAFIQNETYKERQRSLYWVSFPFDVKISDVFGFGEYGEHWILQYYDGAERAKKGLFIDSGTYWKYITNTETILKKGVGYVLALDLNKVQFLHGVEDVSLYFPSTGEIGIIKGDGETTTMEVPAHQCTITHGQMDRKIYDSHWNLIGIPGFTDPGMIDVTNYNNKIPEVFLKEDANLGFHYEFDLATNTYNVKRSTVAFKTMYSYLVQYYGTMEWNISAIDNTPAQIAARRNSNSNVPEKVSLRLEIAQNEQMIDQTFVQLQQEKATAEFDMNLDLTKIINSGANIYTLAGTNRIQTAGNTLPMNNATVPVGVVISKAGEYTFRMPDGTDGILVELIDYETNTTTNLLYDEYTVNLTKGTFENRFALFVRPNNTATSLENINGESTTNGKDVRKVLIDNILYIVRDGQIFDARGARVQ